MTQLGVLGAKTIVLRLELHHTADAFEVHARSREFADAAQTFDVDVAVTTVAALCARRLYQAAALVDAQGLGMHAGQLGRDRDDVDGVVLRSHCHDSNRVLGETVVAAVSAWTAARCSSESCVGTSTSTVTMRSPVPFLVAMPLPLTRWREPDAVPGRNRSITREPSSVGTSMSPPSAASANVIGTLTVRLLPSRPNSRCGVT